MTLPSAICVPGRYLSGKVVHQAGVCHLHEVTKDSEYDFPHLFRAMRSQAGLKQNDLAKALEVSSAQVSRIESGKRETPLSKAALWAETCGYRLTFVPTDVETERAGAVEAVTGVDDETLQDLLNLALVLPGMSEEMRRHVRSLIDHWLWERENRLGGPQERQAG